MRHLFLLITLLSSCIKELTPDQLRSDTHRAQQIIWVDYFGLDSDSFPTVVWTESECFGPLDQPGVFEKSFGCVAGYNYLNKIYLPLPFILISDTAFSHEHIHAWHSLSGIYDYNHKRPEWATLPDELDTLLRENGL
jgi:hypothetical protein